MGDLSRVAANLLQLIFIFCVVPVALLGESALDHVSRQRHAAVSKDMPLALSATVSVAKDERRVFTQSVLGIPGHKRSFVKLKDNPGASAALT